VVESILDYFFGRDVIQLALLSYQVRPVRFFQLLVLRFEDVELLNLIKLGVANSSMDKDVVGEL